MNASASKVGLVTAAHTSVITGPTKGTHTTPSPSSGVAAMMAGHQNHSLCVTTRSSVW